MGLASLIAASGALLGGLLGLALLLPANRDGAANRQLALVVLLAAAYQISVLARHAPDIQLFAPLQILGVAIFLLGPGLFIYTSARIRGDHHWHTQQLWHTLPAAVLLVDELLRQWDLPNLNLGPGAPRLIGVLCYLHLLTYLGLALVKVLRARRAAVVGSATLRWLSTLLGACVLLAVPGLIFALGRWLYDAVSWPQQLWSITLMVGTNYLIAFFALLDPTVFQGSRPGRRGHNSPARYETSSLTDARAQELWLQIENLMQSEQPYLQNQLKVGDLAARLEVPASHLSQTINQVGGCSFANYLNAYRIGTAKELLRNSAPGQRTMLDVALSAGFNSESVFYKHFRDQVGQTPRQFQQQS